MIYLGACLWIGCQNVQTARYEICGIAILLGSSSIIHMTCAMSMIASLVGSDIGDQPHHFKRQYTFQYKSETKVNIWKNTFNPFQKAVDSFMAPQICSIKQFRVLLQFQYTNLCQSFQIQSTLLFCISSGFLLLEQEGVSYLVSFFGHSL